MGLRGGICHLCFDPLIHRPCACRQLCFDLRIDWYILSGQLHVADTCVGFMHMDQFVYKCLSFSRACNVTRTSWLKAVNVSFSRNDQEPWKKSAEYVFLGK